MFAFPFICQYVDNLLVALPRHEVDNILNVFNTFHQKLKFTLETEKENYVPFFWVRRLSSLPIILLNWVTALSSPVLEFWPLLEYSAELSFEVKDRSHTGSQAQSRKHIPLCFSRICAQHGYY